jgi:hypothetical protein
MSGFGRTCNENVIKPCRYPVSCIVVRPEQYGIVANRNELRQPASQHHGRTAEGGDKTTEAAASGKATEAESGGKRSCISPGITDHSNAIGTANCSKAGACERFSNGEACRA